MLQKIVRQSRTRLHDAADNLEDFQKIIDEILSDHISVGQASTHRGFSDRDAHKLLKYLAQRGATSFRMQAREDGSSVVSINRRPKFVLARQQSLLLRVLAEQRFGPQPDRYLTNKELKALLEADGEVPTDENLATNFSRLRDRLVEVGVNPYYVERKREKGARFIFASDAKLDIDPALKDAI